VIAPAGRPQSFSVPGVFNGIAASSARNAWAVGSGPGVLIAHLNGKAWRRVRTPHLAAGAAGLFAVTAASARAAWAVGSTGSGAMLILRWNGRAWSRAQVPHPGVHGNLLGVSATSARNAWAVGSTSGGKAVILTGN